MGSENKQKIVFMPHLNISGDIFEYFTQGTPEVKITHCCEIVSTQGQPAHAQIWSLENACAQQRTWALSTVEPTVD